MGTTYRTRKCMFMTALFSIMCIVGLLVLQLTPKGLSTIKKESNYAIGIIPSFIVKVEWLYLLAVVLYTAGLVILNTCDSRWYIIPLAIFITVQFVYSTWQLLDRETYIQDQLELSWQESYTNNMSNLQDIQEQWQCQGFRDLMDRPASLLSPHQKNIVLSACYPILNKAFGSTVFVWGVGLWVAKLIQAIGFLTCYALYLHTSYDFSTKHNNSDIEKFYEDEAVLVELKQSFVIEKKLPSLNSNTKL